jgi:hypothetical protein
LSLMLTEREISWNLQTIHQILIAMLRYSSFSDYHVNFSFSTWT